MAWAPPGFVTSTIQAEDPVLLALMLNFFVEIIE